MNWWEQLFERAEPPGWFDECRLRSRAQWLTWARPVRRLLSEFTEESKPWPEPRHVRLLGGVEFDHTFTVDPVWRRNLRCGAGIAHLAEAVLATQPGTGVFLFRDLLDDGFDGLALSKLWAVLRDIMAEQCGNPMAALYAPLSYVGRHAADFPLHADLYAPDHLWNVFDRVPADGTGAATLLPLADFFALAESVGVPAAVLAGLRACFDEQQGGERFRRFYDLLHVNDDPIMQALAQASDNAAVRLPLRQGEGYLIHDRAWLHGREAATGGIARRRVHRLVFSARASEQPHV